jgi:hypothetical protein
MYAEDLYELLMFFGAIMDSLASSAFHLGRMRADYAVRRFGFIREVRTSHSPYQRRFRKYGYR